MLAALVVAAAAAAAYDGYVLRRTSLVADTIFTVQSVGPLEPLSMPDVEPCSKRSDPCLRMLPSASDVVAVVVDAAVEYVKLVSWRVGIDGDLLRADRLSQDRPISGWDRGTLGFSIVACMGMSTTSCKTSTTTDSFVCRISSPISLHASSCQQTVQMPDGSLIVNAMKHASCTYWSTHTLSLFFLLSGRKC